MSKLSMLEIWGPTLPGKPAQPAWRASIRAPYHDKDGLPPTKTHPLRVLAMDAATVAVKRKGGKPFADGKTTKAQLHVPRLLDAWLRGDDASEPDPDKYLELALHGALSHAFAPKDVMYPKESHVLLEPLVTAAPEGAAEWPEPTLADSKKGDVSLPALRLVGGSLKAHVRKDPQSKAWLLLRDLVDQQGGVDIELDPLGMVFDALLPWPGSATPRRGRVRLTWGLKGGLGQPKLTLLTSNALDAAWDAMKLTFAAPSTRRWCSLRFEGQTCPPVTWDLEMLPSGALAFTHDLPSVTVPGDAVRIRLSDAPDATARSVATLLPTAAQLHQLKDGTVVMDAWTDSLSKAPIDVTYSATATSEMLTFARWKEKERQPLVLDVDVAGLAALLRKAHGVGEPKPAPRAEKVTAAGTGAEKKAPEAVPTIEPVAPPLTWAFMPVSRGWLQVPVPNVTTLQADSGAFVPPPDPYSGRFMTGFFTVGSLATPPGAGRAPWLVTIDDVGGFDASFTSSASVTIRFREPRFSWRGLLWISRDAPSADDALPRLTAGPGALVDLECRNAAADARQFGLSFAMSATIEGAAQLQATIDIRWDPSRVPNALGGPMDDDQPDAAVGEESCRKLEEVARCFRPGFTSAGGTPRQRVVSAAAEVTPISWLRHPRVPLIAEMPMTRSARSGVAPLESRSLAPFVPEREPGKDWSIQVTSLGQRLFGEIPALASWQKWIAWPWWQPLAKDDVEQPGVAFAALGCPGVEVIPESEDWASTLVAYRLDLPHRDEAHALAELPPVADLPGASAESASLPPPATANDVVALSRHWSRQQDLRALTVVVDSTAWPFSRPAAALRSIDSLLRPYVMTLPAAVDLFEKDERLPLGALRRGEPPRVDRGDVALQGVSGALEITEDGTMKLVDQSHSALRTDLINWSPSSLARDGRWDDVQGWGVGATISTGELVGVDVTRRWMTPGAPTRLVTTHAALPLRVGAKSTWAFSFRDLAISKPPEATSVWRAELEPEGGPDAAAWSRIALVRNSIEWHLHDVANDQSTREWLDLGGFYFHPLRLVAASVASDDDGHPQRVLSLGLVGRLELPCAAGHDRPERTGNLVRLDFERGAAADAPLVLKRTTRVRLVDARFDSSDEPLRWAVVAEDASKRHVALTLSARLSKEAEPTMVSWAIDAEVLGSRWRIPMNADASMRRLTGTWAPAAPEPGKPGAWMTCVELDLPVDATMPTLACSFTVEVAAPKGGATPFSWDMDGKPRWLGIELPVVASVPAIFTERRALEAAWSEQRNAREQLAGGLFIEKPLLSAALGLVFEPASEPDADGWNDGRPVLRAVSGFIELEARDQRIDAGDKALVLIRHQVRSPRRNEWSSELRVWGSVTSSSLIRWPRVGAIAPKGATCAVSFEEKHARHDVTLRFDAHGIPLESFGPGSPPRLAVPWMFLALARHDVLRDNRTLATWTGLGRFTLRDIATLAAGADEEVVFLPRYRKGSADATSVQDDPNVLHPGLVRTQFGLEGRHSVAFLDRLKSTAKPGAALLTGGFLGIIATPGRDARVIGLPFFGGFAGADVTTLRELLQVPEGGMTVELARADAEACAPITPLDARTVASAVVPGSATERGIASILGDHAFEEVEQFLHVGALPIEQRRVANGQPATTWPYWLRSAIALDAMLKDRFESAPPLQATSIVPSLDASNGPPASVRCRLVSGDPLPPVLLSVVDRPVVLAAGDSGSSEQDWPSGAADAAAIRRQALALAQLRHRLPLTIAVLPRGGACPIDVAVPASLASRLGTSMPRARAADEAVFASPARGWPGGRSRQATSLQAPVHGRVIAAVSTEEGVSGLATSVSFGAAAPPALNDVAELTWWTHRRVPSYQPSEVAALRCPPVAALAPATARPRLPRAEDIRAALHGADDAERQPALPPVLATFTCGERAGVVMVERDSLVEAIDNSHLDQGAARFGVRARMGSGAPRHVRTPRPVRLPENDRNKPLRARRPCPWLGEPDPSCMFVRGAADSMPFTYGGLEGLLVVALKSPRSSVLGAGRSEGYVVTVEARVASVTEPAQGMIDEVLGTVLLRASTRVRLVVDGSPRAFGLAMAEGDAPAWKPAADKTLYSCTRSIRLSFGDSPTAGTKDADTQALVDESLKVAFARGRVPPVSMCFDAWDEGTTTWPTGTQVLAPEKPPAPVEPGRQLRLDLWAVEAGRVHLPLVPATILFTDPSYDRELGSTPPRIEGPCIEAGGSMRFTATLMADRGQLERQETAWLLLRLVAQDTGKYSFPPTASVSPRLVLRVVRPDGTSEPVERTAGGKLTLPAPKPNEPTATTERMLVFRLDLPSLKSAVSQAPLVLAAGDALVVSLEDTEVPFVTPKDPPEVAHAAGVALRFQIVARPTIPPPTSAYAALVRRESQAGTIGFDTALHAQSPLPDRVEFVDLVPDFERGYIRRRATFRWPIVLARDEGVGAFVMKMDITGSTHLPADESELVALRVVDV